MASISGSQAENISSIQSVESTSLLLVPTSTSITNGSTEYSSTEQTNVETINSRNVNQQQQEEEGEDYNTTNKLLLQEMEHSWPSTYERSISLLASPIIPIHNVALYTKSPKPGNISVASLIAARRGQLDRGYYTNMTPELRQQQFIGGGGGVGNRTNNGEQDDDDDDNNNNDRMGNADDNDSRQLLRGSLGRVKSMDFWKTTTTTTGSHQPQQQPFINNNNNNNVHNLLQTVQTKQQQRLTKAQEYRQKILQQSNNDTTANVNIVTHRRTKSITKDDTKSTDFTSTGGATKATFYQCTFNLANILMGVGLLGLPYVYSIAGYYGGTFCIIAFGTITWYTSILIGRALNGDPRPSYYFRTDQSAQCKSRMLPPITSFPDIARSAFGQYGCIVLSSILYFELFSCIAIFFVSMGDHLHQLIPHVSATTHMILVGCISMIPTIVLRTPALLSYLSMVGTFATTAVVISVIASAFTEGNIAQSVAETERLDSIPPYHVGWKTDGLTLAFGLVAYCFSGHAIIPSIYSSMEKPHEFDNMVTYTFILVVGCCLSVAFSGYFIFGSTVQDQVTLSLERSSQAVTAMKALTWLMIMTAFSKVTLTMFPLALGMEEIVAPYLSSERMVDMASASIKLLLTILALCVSIFFPSFSLLCSFVGVICSITVSVIFPAAAHLKMFGRHLTIVEKVIDWMFIILGIAMGIAGTVATLQ